MRLWLLTTISACWAMSGCTPAAASLSLPFHEEFDGDRLAAHWSSQDPGWKAIKGKLFNDGAHNIPLFLNLDLPDDVQVRFTARSESPDVDLKFEIFTDGRTHQSGYVIILAGWQNSKSIIARLDEHGPERSAARKLELRRTPVSAASKQAFMSSREVVGRAFRGQMGRTYAFTFRRQGGLLRFLVDDQPHLDYFDPSPLGGAGHNRFAFNNWASPVFFDDLRITALPTGRP